MKLTTVSVESFKGSSNFTFQLHNLDVKSLIFSLSYAVLKSEQNFLTATYRNKRDSYILLNRVPLLYLYNMSNLNYGLSSFANNQAVSNHLCCLDLQLIDDDELILNFKLSSGSDDEVNDFVLSVLEESFLHSPIKYEITESKNEVFHNVEGLYLLDSSLNYKNYNQVTLKVSGEEKSARVSSYLDYMFLFGQYEYLSVDDQISLCLLYKDDLKVFIIGKYKKNMLKFIGKKLN